MKHIFEGSVTLQNLIQPKFHYNYEMYPYLNNKIRYIWWNMRKLFRYVRQMHKTSFQHLKAGNKNTECFLVP